LEKNQLPKEMLDIVSAMMKFIEKSENDFTTDRNTDIEEDVHEN